MIDAPHVINVASFQDAWIAAARHVRQNHWAVRNLVVQIADPTAFRQALHERMSKFASHVGVLGPKHVAYTIFPHRLHAKCGTAAKLYNAYNRPKGLCERVVRRANNHWGTYFQRITAYPTSNGPVNQLDRIIAAIRSDPNTFSAAFAMVIQKPGGETTRRLGGPCLNYVAVQLDAGPPLTLGLLCTYRNHDFLERAYGNYWGLCNLLRFMADESGAQPGPLTCISSRAFVDKHKGDLKTLLDDLP
jgi:thymidylate synthase